MKKILLIIVVLVSAFTGCTDQFEDFNTDKKNPAIVPGESLFSNAQKELADYTSNTNVNINIFKLMAQYWTETTYIDEANYDLVTRNISTSIYFRMYLRVLTDLKEAAKLIDADAKMDAKEKQNKLQIIEVLHVYCYSHLADVFGAIPYSESLDVANVYPKYESGASIYTSLFTRLDAAISKIDKSADSFGSLDLYYGGDTEAWVKFANMLKVRMAITIADADDAKAKAAIEAAYANAFSSNSDDCKISYLTSSPNYNQLYADLIASGRKDFVPANTIVDAMAEINDPRLNAYFRDKMEVQFPKEGNVSQSDTILISQPIRLFYNDNTSAYKNPDSIVLKGDATKKVYGIIVPQSDTILAPTYYLGGEYGFPNSYSQCSHISATVEAPDFPGIMATYTEQCFYLAEAAERGYSVGKTAAEWYEEGIKASFDAWSVSGASAYLAKPEVAYATATGTWRQKIGIQSWIANYTRGYEAYNNWRRLDFPVLNLPEQATTYSDIPVRFTFPVNEQTLNAEQYKAGALLVGGDVIGTKIFWDKY